MDIRKTAGGLWAVDIDSDTYEFERWGAEDGLDTLMDIGAIVGGPVAATLSAMFGGEGKGSDTVVTPDLAKAVVTELVSNMGQNKPKVMEIFKKLAGRNVSCNGKPVAFSDHYSNKYALLFRVVYAGFEVQYGSFFGEFLGKKGRASEEPIQALTPGPTA
jgi:hypothetical protein